MASNDMRHLEHLPAVAEGDVSVIRSKEATYQGSWKRAGGRSAWFMMRRNMDRLLTMMERVEFQVHPDEIPTEDGQVFTMGTKEFSHLLQALRSEDLFAMIRSDPSGRDGSVLASLRDLRRYAVLVEAEMIAEGHVRPEYGPGDGSGQGSAIAEPDDTIHPGLDLTERLLDQVLRLVCPEWSDETRAESVAHATMKMSGASVYDQAAFVTGVPRETVKVDVLGRMYGFGSLSTIDPSLAPLTIMIEQAVSHAVNYAGLDAKLNTPDHVLAELLAPRIVAYLARRTDGQILDAGWTISDDGEGRAIPPEGWTGFPSVKLVLESSNGGYPIAPPRWSEADPDAGAVTAPTDDPSGPGSPADGGHHAPGDGSVWCRDLSLLTSRIEFLFGTVPDYVKISVTVRGEFPPSEELIFTRNSDDQVVYQRSGSSLLQNVSKLPNLIGTRWEEGSIRALRADPVWEAVY